MVVLLLRFWVFDDLASEGAAPFAADGAGCGCSVLYRECPLGWPEVLLEDSLGCVGWAAIALSRDSLLRELMGWATLDCSASSLATFWRLYAGSATLCDAVHWTRRSERRCSECDEDAGRGRRGLCKRRAVGDGRRVREAALMAALQRTWRGRELTSAWRCCCSWRRGMRVRMLL